MLKEKYNVTEEEFTKKNGRISDSPLEKLPPLCQEDRNLAQRPSRLPLVKANFHQEYMEERERKMIAMYERQQQTALEKVRQMFQHTKYPWQRQYNSARARYDTAIDNEQEYDTPARKMSGVDKPFPVKPVYQTRAYSLSNIYNSNNEMETLKPLEAQRLPRDAFPSPSLDYPGRYDGRLGRRCSGRQLLEDQPPVIHMPSSYGEISSMPRGSKWLEERLEEDQLRLAEKIRRKEIALQEKLQRVMEKLGKVQREKYSSSGVMERREKVEVGMERGKWEKEKETRDSEKIAYTDQERRDRREREKAVYSDQERLDRREREKAVYSDQERLDRREREKAVYSDQERRDRREREKAVYSDQERLDRREREKAVYSDQERRDRREREKAVYSDQERRDRREREKVVYSDQERRDRREREKVVYSDQERRDRREREDRERERRERELVRERERWEREQERERAKEVEREREKRDREKTKANELERERRQWERERGRGWERAQRRWTQEKQHEVLQRRETERNGHGSGRRLPHEVSPRGPVHAVEETSRGLQLELSPERSSEALFQLLPCRLCHRNFAADRLEKHLKVCEKVQRSKRKVFDSSKYRAKGTDLEEYLKTNSRRKTPEVKKSNWRQKHEALIRNLRQGRTVSEGPSHQQANMDDDDEYQTCPHCARRFAPGPAERHIPKCQNIRSRPPPPRGRHK